MLEHRYPSLKSSELLNINVKHPKKHIKNKIRNAANIISTKSRWSTPSQLLGSTLSRLIYFKNRKTKKIADVETRHIASARNSATIIKNWVITYIIFQISKQNLVFTTFTIMISTRIKDLIILNRILFIHYLVKF